MRASAGEVERHGIKFEKNLFERRGAFTVALKHEPRVATALASLSHQIADLVPSVAYAADELHTTLCLYGKSINFVYDADDAAQQKLLHALEHAAKMVCQKNREVVFDFVEYIMTPEAVIAAGVPDQSFVDVLEAMVTEAACQ
ncbi:MAG: hypothetical protein Q7R71_00110, partial [bacterium]|nr:hypothetical protein [bacterium]